MRRRELRFDLEELDDRSVPVALVTPPDSERYRLTLDGKWLKEIGPRPEDHRRYRWFSPTLQQRPGAFTVADLTRYVPDDRRKHLVRAWEKAILDDTGQAGKRFPRSVDEATIQQQIDAFVDYGGQFKVIKDSLYRISAEPFLGLRDDGFVIGNHSIRGWAREAHFPYELYSCAETSSLMRMSSALDPHGEHRTSLDRFEIGDPDNFTPSFILERQSLLVSWMYSVLASYADDLRRHSKARFESALADRIDGGLGAFRLAAVRKIRGEVDLATPGMIDIVHSLSSDAVIRAAIDVAKNASTILSVLREEWEDRPVVIQPRYPLKAS